MNHCELPIQSVWGKVPIDRVVRLSSFLVEMERITIVKGWVKNHATSVLSKILLSEENDQIYLSPYSGASMGPKVTPAYLQASLAQKRPSHPVVATKGKKPCLESVGAGDCPGPEV